MRCSRKSTTWRASRAGAALALAACAPALLLAGGPPRAAVLAPAPGPGTLAAVQAAIVSAVRARVGTSARVTLEDLEVRGDIGTAATLVAVLDPSTRLGTRTRIPLRALHGRGRRVRVGEAACVIRAEAPRLEVVTPIARGTAVAADAVRLQTGELDGLPLRPPITVLAGATARRDLAPGEIVLPHDVRIPPAVRTGDQVRVRVLHGGVDVTAAGIARQDGDIGDEIRILNPSSGRVLRGRVVGPRECEITHGT